MNLKVSRIHKTYHQAGENIQVLKGLELEVTSGETVAILGQSGSGKSTLLALLSGLDRPDQGDILVQGTNLAKLSEAEMTEFRAKHIGIVFQQFHLMPHLTALENVSLPLMILKTPGAENRAEELLKQLGLGHRLHHSPTQMSGGECQRVAIARALVTNPTYVLADEPSGNLDTRTAKAVMDVFFDTLKARKQTALVVTHSEALAARCQRQVLLQDGVLCS